MHDDRVGSGPRMLTALLAAVLLGCAHPASSVTVHSLDQIGSKLTTGESRAFVAEQLQGAPAPDRLGTRMPVGLRAATVAKLVLPADASGPATLVGVKPWTGYRNRYVAIVCTGGAGPLEPGQPQCARADDASAAPSRIYLGVIALRNGVPVVIARGGPFDVAMHWNESGLLREPMAAEDDLGKPTGAAIRPDSVLGFDLAPRAIGAGGPAFGVVTAWMESYSGGGAFFTGLNLFAIDGRSVRHVFAAPISAYSDVAGNWHNNGTRDHTITDAANILVVSRQRTHGYSDLIVTSANGCWKRVYRWSAAARAYRA